MIAAWRTKQRKPGRKSWRARHSDRSGPSVSAYVGDVNWYEAGPGYVYADVGSLAAADVILEASPCSGRFYARSAGFELLVKAQLHPIA